MRNHFQMEFWKGWIDGERFKHSDRGPIPHLPPGANRSAMEILQLRFSVVLAGFLDEELAPKEIDADQFIVKFRA